MSRSVREEISANWIQKALNPATKGKLHRRLGIPQDEKIPLGKLEKATRSTDPSLRREAQFAENVRNLKRKK